MKKNLLSVLICTFIFNVNSKAQETKISFETAEGFVLGNFNGQKNWSNWGYVDNNHSNIINTIATDGVNSVAITADEAQEENWGGIFYDAPSYKKMSISADVYLDAKNASDYDMLSLYSMDVEEYERLGGFYFNFNSGIDIGDDVNSVTVNTWTEKKWYNLKIVIDFTAKKVDYYLDNVKKTTTTFNSNINTIKEFDFEFDNYKSGFKIDKVKIQNLENLAVTDLSKNEIKIYPNPVKDLLKIASKENIESVEIFDINGKQVLKTQFGTSLDVKNLTSGLYIIKIKTQNETLTEKFIKN